MNSLLLLGLPPAAFAELHEWPSSDHPRMSTITIFSPGRPNSLAYSLGVKSEWSDPHWFKDVKRDSFQLLSLNDSWNRRQKCSSAPRTQGYIHTTSAILDHNEALVVSFPVSFTMAGDFTSSRAAQVRAWPLLRVSVWKLVYPKNPRPTYSELKQIKSTVFTVGDLQQNPFNQTIHSNTDTHIEVRFQNLLFSNLIRMRKKSDYRIRIEWSSEGICDESNFSLKVGDQIRTLRADSQEQSKGETLNEDQDSNSDFLNSFTGL